MQADRYDPTGGKNLQREYCCQASARSAHCAWQRGKRIRPFDALVSTPPRAFIIRTGAAKQTTHLERARNEKIRAARFWARNPCQVFAATRANFLQRPATETDKILSKNGTDFGAKIQHPYNKKLAQFLVPKSFRKHSPKLPRNILKHIQFQNLARFSCPDSGTKNGANFLIDGCWILAPKSVPFFN